MSDAEPDIVERLRVWPAAYGEDAMSSTYVGNMAKAAADEIERLRCNSPAVSAQELAIALHSVTPGNEGYEPNIGHPCFDSEYLFPAQALLRKFEITKRRPPNDGGGQ